MIRIRLLSILLLFVLWLVTSLVVAQNPEPPTLTDSPECDNCCATLVYNPADGNLSVTTGIDHSTGSRLKLTALEITSENALFIPGPDADGDGIGDNCEGFGGDFDVCSREKIAKVSTRGFDSLSFGIILPTGLSGETLVDDWLVDGSGTTIHCDGRVFLHPFRLYVIPEPSGTPLGIVSLFILLLFRRDPM